MRRIHFESVPFHFLVERRPIDLQKLCSLLFQRLKVVGIIELECCIPKHPDLHTTRFTPDSRRRPFPRFLDVVRDVLFLHRHTDARVRYPRRLDRVPLEILRRLVA